MADQQPKLEVLALSDGRPGHFNKTRAVIRALRSQYEVSETWVDVTLRKSWARRLMAWVLNATGRSSGYEWLLRFGYGDVVVSADAQPDLIVSTGGNTMYANVILARRYGCPNLFVGGLRSMKPGHFWRIIHHRAYQPSPPHLQWPVTLVDMDRGELAKEAEALKLRLGLSGGPWWALLLGGDGGGFHYTQGDMEDLARCIQRTHERDGVRWLITSSRRTGEENERYLKSLLAPEWIAATSWAGEEGPNDYRGFLGLAERIVCTEDSQMMMAEAIAAGKPVLSLRPRRGEASNRDFLPRYEAEGLIARQTIEAAAKDGCHWSEPKDGGCDGNLDQLGECLADALTRSDR